MAGDQSPEEERRALEPHGRRHTRGKAHREKRGGRRAREVASVAARNGLAGALPVGCVSAGSKKSRSVQALLSLRKAAAMDVPDSRLFSR